LRSRLELLSLAVFSSLVVACGVRLTSKTHFHFRIVGDDPDGILREAALNATQRWRSAIGLDIRLLDADEKQDAPYTIQWVTPDEMRKAPGGVTASGELAGGLTVNPSTFVKHILIRNDLGDFDLVESVLVHEMAHTLTDNQKHAKSGVFAPQTVTGAPINQDVLDTVCERVDCQFAIPEPDPSQQT
jgi:hypothetical protein